MIKTRFCPSPTGHMHLGNVRTALFNALLARGHQGIFLLRIEDTDQQRSHADFTDVLLEDLRWLGLLWQEGPEVGGDAVPYWQSERQSIYDQYYQQLEAEGFIYPCFCSEQQLAINRKVQLASGQPPRYPGTCRHLTPDAIARKQYDEGISPTLRFRVPSGQTVEFVDLVRGSQVFKTDDLGDFVIRRADGTAPFLFCNALDDALMGVTHALRGEDHLANTPRQLLILQALNLPKPQYGHISLILGPDGSPLSKRHGSRSIKELREIGYLPAGLLNYLARLGHFYQQPAWMDIAELAVHFSTDHLSAAPARFDPVQLSYWQKEAVMRCDNASLWEWMGDDVAALVPVGLRQLFIDAIKPNICFPADALLFAKNLFGDKLVYPESELVILSQAGTAFFQAALQAVDQHGIDFKALSQEVGEALGVKGKALFQPLRVALTGLQHGPEMALITEMLGVEGIRKRLQQVPEIIRHA